MPGKKLKNTKNVYKYKQQKNKSFPSKVPMRAA